MTTTEYIYVVTEYGCNSGAHCMWPPRSKVFTSYNVAYEFFSKVAPRMNDPDNRAKRSGLSSEEYRAYCEAQKEYIIIEERVQTPGYLDGDGTCAKRPQGAVFAATKLIQ